MQGASRKDCKGWTEAVFPSVPGPYVTPFTYSFRELTTRLTMRQDTCKYREMGHRLCTAEKDPTKSSCSYREFLRLTSSFIDYGRYTDRALRLDV
jgi:hypothetical protein